MTRIFKNKTDLIKQVFSKKDIVLDVGFWGQGIDIANPYWPHKILCEETSLVDGVDLVVDSEKVKSLNPKGTYVSANVENFFMKKKYTKIFAADIIEHLSNPGLFLSQCKEHLSEGGVLILTTPNAFNLFSIAGKIMHFEPQTNSDHTCYFNTTTISQFLKKNGWKVNEYGFVYTLGYLHKESFKKKVLNGVYRLLSLITYKYMETMVIIASPDTDKKI